MGRYGPPYLNLSGVDYRTEGLRIRKLIGDMADSHVTIIVDEENEASRFTADNGKFDSWIPWEHQPGMGADMLSHFLKDGSRMPYGCQL